MRFDLTDFATFHSKSFEQIDTNVFYHDGGYSYNKQGQIYMNYDYQIGRYNYDIRAQRINISMESGWERRSRELNDLR